MFANLTLVCQWLSAPASLKGVVALRIDSGIRKELAQGGNLVFWKAMVGVVKSMGEAI